MAMSRQSLPPVNKYTGSYTEDVDGDGVRLNAFGHDDASMWPAADRHAILAVAHRDVRVARQNIAEMMLYIDDHAAHLANCASAGDDSLTLMSTELIPRLEGGIRAVLDEAANL